MKNKILALIFIIISIFVFFIAQKNNDYLQLNICDVGQGDGAIIRSAGGKLIVVDGGPDRKILDCIEELSVFKAKTIDYMILTHPHKDHVAGLVELLERYDVGIVIMAYEESYDNDEYEVFREKLEDINMEWVMSGEVFEIEEGLRLEFVWPIYGYSAKNVNDESLVTRIVYKNSCFLLTGDAGSDFEKYYAENFSDCDGLKVGHHGSKFATSKYFLEVVRPKIAVISSGENTYGHPSGEVLSRLSQSGANIFRTNEGTVKIVSSGLEWYIADTK
ncbi:MBL fold metallo-hydrolase [Candidatus Curtissbacteria bacterium]|nr:MBL fold metallo-hydrolase [Candidatus Curtissbacteria bacterium]